MIEANNEKEQIIEAKETQIANLAKKIKASKDLIFKLQKEIRENQLYYQKELKKTREIYQARLQPLQEEINQLKTKLAEVLSGETDQSRELKARSKLITTLEQQTKEQKQALDLANSKSKQLQV